MAPAPTPDSPRHCLVTGGAGFVGSHLVGLLLARGDRVSVVDDLSTGRRANLPASHERLRFIEADLREALHALGKGEVFDEIYHLAAAVGVKLVIADPIRAIETNIEQAAALLRFAVDRPTARGPAPTLITSSSEVYGKGLRSPFREDDDVVYGPTTVSRWSYACAKAIDEHLALAYHAQHSLPAVVVRLFNTVGPRQAGEYGMVLPRFVAAAVEGRPLEVYGDGSQSRCFCDVRDVTPALPRLLANTACHGRVFNIGAETPITIRRLAETVIETLGSRSPIVHVAYAQAYGSGFEDLAARRPDLTRVREAIGFTPAIALEQTIRDLAASLGAPAPMAGSPR